MTVEEMMQKRADVGARYADLVLELLEVRVELMALDHVTASPIAGPRHSESGFVDAGGTNELPRLLCHAVFAPHAPYAGRRLSAEVDKRVSQLAESLRAAA